MLKYIKSVDIYGHPIGVHYKGQTTHATILGSVFSIIMIAAVLLFAADRYLSMITNSVQTEFSREIVADVGLDGQVKFSDLNFNLLFQTTGFRSDGSVDFNFRLPDRIGRWIARLSTVNAKRDFASTFEPVKIIDLDDYSNIEAFEDDFGISE